MTITRGSAAAPTTHAPPLEAHRLIGDGRSAALVLPDATIDWLCAPAFDSPPLLWWLLDPTGPAAAWRGARPVHRDQRPAGPSARTVVEVDGRRVECWDGLVTGKTGTGSLLIRLVRALDEPLDLTHELQIAGLGTERGSWVDGTAAVETVAITVAGGRSDSSGACLATTVHARLGRWSGMCVGFDGNAVGEVAVLVELLNRAEARLERLLDGARLPRHHPERARDALLVLNTCTYEPTGAIIAAPTTSLPEAPGGTAQWDYRYTWLRDASLAVSVAALLGRRDSPSGTSNSSLT